MLLLHSSPGTNKYTCLNFAKCKVITCEVTDFQDIKFYIDGNIVVTASGNACFESAKTNNFCTLSEILKLEQSFDICSDKMTLLPAVIFHYLDDESKEDFLEYYRKYCLAIKEAEVKEAIDRLIYEKNKEDAEILENMITSRGYKIIYHELIEPSIDTGNDNKVSAIHIRKENTHSVVLNYNISTSKKEGLNGRLYLSIRHKGGYVAKKDTIKYHYSKATNETPFIQIFADTEPEKVDTFFMLIDALTEITTEDDFIRYRDFTCKAAKQNLLMLKSINKLE